MHTESLVAPGLIGQSRTQDFILPLVLPTTTMGLKKEGKVESR